MRPKDSARWRQRCQRGFTLVASIFLLVVLSLLAGYATYFVSVQSNTVLMSLRSAQALQAANAGLEYAAWQILRNAGSCGSTTLAAGTLGGTLAGYTVQVTCVSTSHADDGTGAAVTDYSLTSKASTGVMGRDYVERQVTSILVQ